MSETRHEANPTRVRSKLPRPLRSRTQRLGALLSMLLLAMSVYAGRLVQLQVWQHDRWTELSEQNHRRTHTIEKKRGEITDRNGQKLALSTEVYSVYAYTPEVASMAALATVLSTVLPQTREEILAGVTGRRGYLRIAKQVECATAERIRAMKLPGVTLEEEFRRVYPEKKLAANLLGFCGAEGNGLEGIELHFDKTLRGYPGLAIDDDLSVNRGSGIHRTIVRLPTGGSNITLAIDAVIQHILETELAAMVDEFHPHDANAVALDPYTGEILGMAGWPTYDLNEFAKASPDARRNRIAVDIFEPGSCMKIFAVAAGYDSHKLNDGTRFHCKGHAEIFGKRIKCHGSHGLVDPYMAIAESCNSSMVAISQMVDQDDLYRTYRAFGFNERTGIDLPKEDVGIFRPPSRWSGLSAPSLSIGQEIAITAVQLVAAYGAIANDGWLMTPHLVKRISSFQGDLVEETLPKPRRQVLNPALCHKLRQMLSGVIEKGTGSLAKMNDYTAGGKTSTAQKANPRGGYFWDKVVTSFVGMAPIEHPRIVLLVLANEPRGDKTALFGGKVAGPYWGRAMDRILKHLKVPPDKHQAAGGPGAANAGVVATMTVADLAGSSGAGTAVLNTSIQKNTVPLPPLASAAVTPPPLTASESLARIASGSSPLELARVPASFAATLGTPTMPAPIPTLPNLKGMTLREVADVVRGLPIKPILEGNGLAIHQSWPPGTPLDRIDRLVVHFSPRALAVPTRPH